jgi:UDP-N-acetylmuramoylalanine--D-glutamate ligase
MLNIPQKGNLIFILGAWGKSGQAMIQLAEIQGISYILYDDHESDSPLPSGKCFSKCIQGANNLNDYLNNIEDTQTDTGQKPDFICISPGFPLRRPEVNRFKKLGVPIIGEAEWGLSFFQDKIKIGITGTDGKSSLCYYITQLLTSLGFKATAAGNIGNPLCELAKTQIEETKSEVDILVIEFSSYQLELPERIELDLALLSNFSADHQNRYDTLGDYLKAKLNIIRTLKDDGRLVIGNYIEQNKKTQDKSGRMIAGNFQLSCSQYLGSMYELAQFVKGSKIIRETTGEKMNPIFLLGGGWIRNFRDDPAADSFFLDANVHDLQFPDLFFFNRKIKLTRQGNYILIQNLQSSLSSIEIILNKLFNEVKKTELSKELINELKLKVTESVNEIKILNHRLEYITEKDGVTFYNDSKATTIQSVKAAVSSFDEPLHLLLGGRNKGADFTELLPVLELKDVTVYAFGEDGKTIAEELKLSSEKVFSSLEAAFQKAASNARKNDIVLLSPGCTSWDAFENFEERGDFFKKLVLDLKD